MAKPMIFVSFDFENDRNYKYTLNMWMPLFFTMINTMRIYKEWILLNKVTVALACDTALFMSIFIITWFYFFEIHSKITDFCKKIYSLLIK